MKSKNWDREKQYVKNLFPTCLKWSIKRANKVTCALLGVLKGWKLQWRKTSHFSVACPILNPIGRWMSDWSFGLWYDVMSAFHVMSCLRSFVTAGQTKLIDKQPRSNQAPAEKADPTKVILPPALTTIPIPPSWDVIPRLTPEVIKGTSQQND